MSQFVAVPVVLLLCPSKQGLLPLWAMGSMAHCLHRSALGSVQFVDVSLASGAPKVDPVSTLMKPHLASSVPESFNKPADTKLYCFRLSMCKASPATDLGLTFIFSLLQSLLHHLKCQDPHSLPA